MKTISKLQDKFTKVIYCVPNNKKDYLLSLGYEFVGTTDFNILESKAQNMLNEFENKKFDKDFDFIKMNWLPLFTTQKLRNKFDMQTEKESKLFEIQLKNTEILEPGKIRNHGVLGQAISKIINK